MISFYQESPSQVPQGEDDKSPGTKQLEVSKISFPCGPLCPHRLSLSDSTSPGGTRTSRHDVTREMTWEKEEGLMSVVSVNPAQ